MSSRFTFGSVCSGIEAASVAWAPLGWEAAFFAEIEPFPSAVLAHHYPETPNLGDFTAIQRSPRPISLLVGGTPCQSFSVAGLRRGLADERGNLALEFLRLADRLGPEWLVWENVPGVLSSNGGRDFGAFLGGLAELGYGWAYRVLDAQYAGVPQRRRRVFLVGRAGDWRGPAAVLFERHSLSGDPAPGRTARKDVAGTLDAGTGERRGGGTNPSVIVPDVAHVARALTSHSQRLDGPVETFLPVAHTLRAEGFDASEDGTGRGTPLIPVPFIVKAAESCATQSHARQSETARCLDQTGGFASSQGGTVVAVQEDNQNGVTIRDTTGSLRADAPGTQPCGSLIFERQSFSAVRRLTPLECERLQGFPDGYTAVPYRGKPAADGPRYKALGNSMAVPCMAWIGRRINAVRAVLEASR